jgi:hypothetical protein
MLKSLALAGALLAAWTPSHAQGVGACAWAKRTPQDRQAFLAGYHEGMQRGMAVLSKDDVRLREAVAACTDRQDIPKMWAQAAVAARAIQDGAATELSGRGIGRDQLDQAWLLAPDEARACVRANAAKPLGVGGAPACPEARAPIWFVERFKLSPARDRAAAGQVLIYVNAKAQEDWVEALLATFAARQRIAR